MELPVKIRGIEEMNQELSFQFLDDELQGEEREREEEEGVGEEAEAEEQREEDEKPAQRPLTPSSSSQQGFTCSCCLSNNHYTAYPF